MMCGIDSLRILIPYVKRVAEVKGSKTYSDDRHPEHPKLKSDENDI